VTSSLSHSGRRYAEPDYTWFGLDNLMVGPWRPRRDKIIARRRSPALTRGASSTLMHHYASGPKIALVSISSDSTHKCPGVNRVGY